MKVKKKKKKKHGLMEHRNRGSLNRREFLRMVKNKNKNKRIRIRSYEFNESLKYRIILVHALKWTILYIGM
jgi:hypothetical protein